MFSERTPLGRLFVPRDLTSMAPAVRVLVYALLVAWLLVVLFPLYWLFITSFKLPVQVNDGPDFLPSSTSSPRLMPGATSSSSSGTTRCVPI